RADVPAGDVSGGHPGRSIHTLRTRLHDLSRMVHSQRLHAAGRTDVREGSVPRLPTGSAAATDRQPRRPILLLRRFNGEVVGSRPISPNSPMFSYCTRGERSTHEYTHT